MHIAIFLTSKCVNDCLQYDISVIDCNRAAIFAWYKYEFLLVIISYLFYYFQVLSPREFLKKMYSSTQIERSMLSADVLLYFILNVRFFCIRLVHELSSTISCLLQDSSWVAWKASKFDLKLFIKIIISIIMFVNRYFFGHPYLRCRISSSHLIQSTKFELKLSPFYNIFF